MSKSKKKRSRKTENEVKRCIGDICFDDDGNMIVKVEKKCAENVKDFDAKLAKVITGRRLMRIRVSDDEDESG